MKKRMITLGMFLSLLSLSFAPVSANPFTCINTDVDSILMQSEVADQSNATTSSELEALVKEGVNQANLGNLEKAQTLFAQASRLVEVK